MTQLIYGKRVDGGPPTTDAQLIAGWEFKANSGAIGTDKLGVCNANSDGIQNMTKITGDSPLGEQVLTWQNLGQQYYCKIPYHPLLNHEGRSFSYAFLFKPNPVSGIYNQILLFAKDYYFDSRRTLWLDCWGTPPNDYRFTYGVCNNGLYNIIAHKISNFNSWYLIIAEYFFDPILNNCRQRLFINNALIEEKTPTFFVGDLNDLFYALASRFNGVNSPDISYGSVNHELAFVYRFNGVLSQDQKDYLWNNGNFRYWDV